jgi:hypothetical protein
MEYWSASSGDYCKNLITAPAKKKKKKKKKITAQRVTSNKAKIFYAKYE